MKSVSSEKFVKSALPYPKLMVAPNNGRIVLFISPQIGVEVNSGTDTTSVGSYSEAWADYMFEDFHGSVTLSNED